MTKKCILWSESKSPIVDLLQTLPKALSDLKLVSLSHTSSLWVRQSALTSHIIFQSDATSFFVTQHLFINNQQHFLNNINNNIVTIDYQVSASARFTLTWCCFKHEWMSGWLTIIWFDFDKRFPDQNVFDLHESGLHGLAFGMLTFSWIHTYQIPALAFFVRDS